MTPQAALKESERVEAVAFDRLAASFDERWLKRNDWTFQRYRDATLGRPLFVRYPDLVFVRLGKLFNGSIGTGSKPLAGLRVLDLGAGEGQWSVILAEQGAEVDSIEISPAQVQLARKRMHNVGLRWRARVGSAFDLPVLFDGASFDLVFAQRVLHHLTLDLERVYAGLAYVLRNGGLVVAVEPFSGCAPVRSLRESLASVLPLDKESPSERPLTPADLAALETYFSEVDLEYSDVLERFARRVFKSTRMEAAVFRSERSLMKLKPLRTLAGRVLITAKK